jgi:ubiquinone/menaquinone biosynthesis C-methylase UbiE
VRPHTDRAATADPYDWDGRVEAWQEVATTDSFQRLRDRICELADPAADDRAVDLGAGTGLLALALAPTVAEVIAVDISSRMLEHLRMRADADAGAVQNVLPIVADLRRLPLDDDSATLVVSNYAFHHLDDAGKELALSEARRVLQPGGRLVICDMMFSLSLEPRDLRLITQKLAALARRGPAGLLRIARNAGRLLAGRWEQRAPPETWKRMLADRGFERITVELLEHEAGIALARKPAAVTRLSGPSSTARASSQRRGA